MTSSEPNGNFLPTRESLLSRLRQSDDDASWQEFYDLYHRLLFSFAVRKGLAGPDAEDVVQETLMSVAKTMPTFRYQPNRCSFKSWLRRLAEARIADHFRKTRRKGADKKVLLDEEEFMRLASSEMDSGWDAHDTWWEDEWQQKLLEEAMERVEKSAKPQQFRIFHALVLQERPGPEVAAMFEVNVAVVYVARHRIAARIKKEVRLLEKSLSKDGTLE